MRKIIIPILLTLMILASCIPYINDLYDTDKISTFHYLCDQLENHYVYFDYKGLDFPTIKDTYAGRITNELSDEDFFHQLEAFMNELQDGHANIFAPFTVSSCYSEILEGYEDNFDWDMIKENYLNLHPVYGINLAHSMMETGGSLYGYIFYPSFSNPLTTYEIEYILNRFRKNQVKGIIVDIRNNGGGSLLNVMTMLRYFGGVEPGASTRVFKGWRRDGKELYTEIEAIDLSFVVSTSFHVIANSKVYRGPVALLTNRGSYSAASFTPTGFKAYANVKQIGGITGGGMGLPIGGTLPNGWTYRFSGNIVMDYRATSYTQSEYNYENGVPPDIAVDDNPGTTANDEIIDAALDWINSAEASAFVDTYTD